MSEFSYFNLGFRSENICNVLNNYKKKEKFNKEILLDSEKILNDCLNIENNFSKNLNHSNYELSELIPLVLEIYKGKAIPEIIESIDLIKKIINNIVVNNKSDVEEVYMPYNFFKNLSKICLNRNNYNSIINSI